VGSAGSESRPSGRPKRKSQEKLTDNSM
jgi:hypothetical protein